MTKRRLLVIDIGNTNHVFAVFEGDVLCRSWRMATSAGKTADEYAVVLSYFLQNIALTLADIKDVIISNVVPQTEFAIKELCINYLQCKPVIVGKDGVNPGVVIDVDSPKEVGSDRLVNALSAYHQYKRACIIVDFGTATNFDLVDSQGHYKGGIIAPGVYLSLDALHRATAKLPRVDIAKPNKVVGTSTISAIQSGIFHGYVAMIEGLIKKIKEETKQEFYVVGTGGLTALLAQGTSVFDVIEPNLTIYGLKYIYDLNKK